jgi:hypothetical protein
MLEVKYLGNRNDDRALFREGSQTQLRLRKHINETMEQHGQVTSASGISAQFAIEWCRKNGVGWNLRTTAKPEMYHVTKEGK